MQEWLRPETVAQVGFPTVVAGYLLIRVELAIKNLTKEMSKNTATLQTLFNIRALERERDA